MLYEVITDVGVIEAVGCCRHIAKFVPGTPTVIVQSMPGAGGMTALNYVANVRNNFV